MKIVRGQEFPRHVRSTIAFDGGSGSGAQGTVDVFTITGRVFIERITAFCTESLVSSGGTVMLGGTGDTNAYIVQETASDIDINAWWVGSGTAANVLVNPVQPALTGGAATGQMKKLTASDVIITVDTASVTDGTIVFDVWYEPITDNGNLVAS